MKKRWRWISWLLCFLLVLSGCTKNQQASGSESESAAAEKSGSAEVSSTLSSARQQEESHILVAYFSATGHTEEIAGKLAESLGADLYEIVPETPYTDEDLNYSDAGSRASLERNDPDARPAVAGQVETMDQYDTVLIGYPLWFGSAPRIMQTFMESYDFTGKTLAAFCTSASSGFGSSDASLQAASENASWLTGKRFAADASDEELLSWTDSLDIEPQTAEAEEKTMKMMINQTQTDVKWIENEAVAALQELCREKPLQISASRYGGFEQVGRIGASLPQQDTQITALPGDIMLYQGNQIVIFFGSNTWQYTRLGHIENQRADALRQLLDCPSAEITLTI